MTRGISVAASAAFVATFAVACVAPQKQAPIPPPPPGNAPPRLPGEVAPPPSRIFRFEFDYEPVVSPGGALADRHNSAQGYRFAYFGANPTPNFAVGLSGRIVDTSPVNPVSLYFFDLMGFYFRLHIPVAPQLKGYLEFEPTVVGMHVRCDDPTDFSCNEEGNEFLPRAGLNGRAGGIYEIIPGRLDLGGYIALEKTLPDEGGWFSIGLSIIAHVGPTHAEVKRRQEWYRQQQQQQQQKK